MYKFMHAYMHTCITYITYLYLYLHALFVHDNRSCNKMYNLFFLVGRQGSTLASISMFMAATACQMRRNTSKAQPQLRINCVQMHNGGQARLNRNCGSTAKEDTAATANKCRRKDSEPPQLRRAFRSCPLLFTSSLASLGPAIAKPPSPPSRPSPPARPPPSSPPSPSSA